MPRRNVIPSYRRHKASGQAIVRINGKITYLGRHGSKESIEEYWRMIAEFKAGVAAAATKSAESGPPTKRPAALTIMQLVLRYDEEHVEKHYVKDGKPTSEQECIRNAMRPLLERFADCFVADFGPLALKLVRKDMISLQRCRKRINQDIGRIRRLFKWAVANEMAAVAILQALQSVDGLEAGRSDAVERNNGISPILHNYVTKRRRKRMERRPGGWTGWTKWSRSERKLRRVW